VIIGIGLEGDLQLAQMIEASDALGAMTRAIQPGQQQPDDDRDDGDHHQEFDQGEGIPLSRARRS